MVKPRVFVSSTYYDLKHIRNSLKNFIDGFGYEAVLFEYGDIPYDHKRTVAECCVLEVAKCDILVLIIGGRYGSPISTSESSDSNQKYDDHESVTLKEYRSALEQNLPVYVFIERNVHTEYRTFEANKGNKQKVNYYHVNDERVYRFIDQVYAQKIYPIYEFDRFEDISNVLRDQWAGLFADYLRTRQDQKELSNISAKIKELSLISETLKKYTESLMEKVQPEDFDKIIQDESKKLEDAKKKITFFEHYFPKLIMDTAREDGIKIRKNDIYNAYIQTDDFDDFLKKVGFDEQRIDIIHRLCIYYDGYFELDLSLRPERYPHLINSNEDNVDQK